MDSTFLLILTTFVRMPGVDGILRIYSKGMEWYSDIPLILTTSVRMPAVDGVFPTYSESV